MTAAVNAFARLLARSTAIGTELKFDGEEMILWRTDDGTEFTTSYERAAQYVRGDSMTAEEIIAQYLEDAFALHPGHMTASGLVARLDDGGYGVVQRD